MSKPASARAQEPRANAGDATRLERLRYPDTEAEVDDVPRVR